MSFTVSPAAIGEPHVGDAAAIGVLDLLAELVGCRCDLAGDSPCAQASGNVLAVGPGRVVDHRDEDDRGHRPGHRDKVAAEQDRHQPRDAEGDADAGIRLPAVGGQGVVASAGGDRAHGLESHELGLVDGAGVVVEAAGDAQVGDDGAGSPGVRAVDDGDELLDALVQQHVGDAQRADPVREGCVGRADRGELEAPIRGGRAEARLAGEQVGDLGGADLVELVDGAQHRGRVVGPDAPVEALGELAVVDLDDRRRDGQLGQDAGHDDGHLDLVLERQRVAADHVDVGLGELAEPALLGALAAPHLLDLVAPERELQVPGVLEHVAREGHRQVEVQAQARVGLALAGVQPTQDVDLLVDLALAQHLLERLHRSRLERGEAVQLEHPSRRVEDELLHHLSAGKPLREAGELR